MTYTVSISIHRFILHTHALVYTYLHLSLSIQNRDLHTHHACLTDYWMTTNKSHILCGYYLFVAGAQGCFAPQAPKVRKGWGLMGWIVEISRK